MVLVCCSQPGTHAEYEYFQRVLRYRTLFPSTTRGALVLMVMVVKVKCGKAVLLIAGDGGRRRRRAGDGDVFEAVLAIRWIGESGGANKLNDLTRPRLRTWRFPRPNFGTCVLIGYSRPNCWNRDFMCR
jgi:hypothetical protein